jgi:hypothetical protein
VMAGHKAGNPEIFQISNFKNQQKFYFLLERGGGTGREHITTFLLNLYN